MQISVKINGLDKLKAKLQGHAKQIPYATSRAINATAYKATQDTSAEIKNVFDRVTPWIAKSVRYSKSTKRDLRSTIDLDYWGNKQGVSAEKILKAEIFGGQRHKKRHEIALEKAGILPAGMYIVPGDAADMDEYGNMKSGQIVQIISYFKAFGEQGYQANMSDRRRESLARDKKKTGARGFAYFVLKRRHGKLLPGVYKRVQFGTGSAVKPVMIFVRKAAYKKRLDFYGIVQKSVDKHFEREFEIAWAEAVRTAR